PARQIGFRSRARWVVPPPAPKGFARRPARPEAPAPPPAASFAAPLRLRQILRIHLRAVDALGVLLQKRQPHVTRRPAALYADASAFTPAEMSEISTCRCSSARRDGARMSCR